MGKRWLASVGDRPLSGADADDEVMQMEGGAEGGGKTRQQKAVQDYFRAVVWGYISGSIGAATVCCTKASGEMMQVRGSRYYSFNPPPHSGLFQLWATLKF